MKLELVAVVDKDGDPHVFARRGAPIDEFRTTWALWERPELAAEIRDAVGETLDDLQADADRTMREFLRASAEQVDELDRERNERAIEQEGRT